MQNKDGITDIDLQTLLASNPLAAEQLRRIIAERQREELQAEFDALKASSNGVGLELVDAQAEADIESV